MKWVLLKVEATVEVFSNDESGQTKIFNITKEFTIGQDLIDALGEIILLDEEK